MLEINICIYIIKRKPEQVLKRLQETRISDIAVSSITLSELAYGAAKSAHPDQNRIAPAEFLAPLEILSYDDMAAHEYGRIRTALESKGTPIGSLNMLIAAHARSLNCTRVTNNEREFRNVISLKIENWAKSIR